MHEMERGDIMEYENELKIEMTVGELKEIIWDFRMMPLARLIVDLDWTIPDINLYNPIGNGYSKRYNIKVIKNGT